MDLDLFSFKELDDVFLKLTYPLEINGTWYDEGETIAHFDKISLAPFDEETRFVTAHGGFDNRDRVVWTTHR